MQAATVATRASTRAADRLARVLEARPHWDAKRVTSTHLAIAMSNHVSMYQCDGERVILKIYGKGAEAGLLVRETELANSKLIGELSLGPKVESTFEGGRVEEWIAGRALTHEEMRQPNISRQLARVLRKFHTVTDRNHNDVHCNNVMLRPDGGLTLIDFE